ncbi:hypothetical protein AQZ59_00568 [Trueperella bernardiae]|uniref:Uncharacterized protein n=1 Tax=Trueperella bernardiae TaxID=59561 RepID=A0A0W1KKM9_9ACTO|nr:hypothetical protein [Trueperella bernardiae]KTF04584.1 hypothetical protein AQZ59_00568 [Trueperella bernardiae]
MDEIDVSRAHDAISAPDRVASVVVAVEPNQNYRDGWKQIVSSLTKEMTGIAAVYVVAANAADAFNEELPDAYRIWRVQRVS